MGRIALIIGAAGQDGYHLTRLLQDKGYRLFLADRSFGRIRDWPHWQESWSLHTVDLRVFESIQTVLEEARPDEIINLGGVSFIPHSWEDPIKTMEVNGLAVIRILEWIRHHRPEARFLQASSSEMFGDPRSAPQNEETPLCPTNPYAVAKVVAHHAVGMYRARYGLFACSAILFNHESPQRAGNFVTRKIAAAAAAIKLGRTNQLRLGDVRARRDWGYAGDYVEAMNRMLEAKQADDFVIGTGQLHSVQECAEIAFGHLDLDWQAFTEIDPSLVRPLDHTNLVADPTRARERLGWKPETRFSDLIKMMVEAELETLQHGP